MKFTKFFTILSIIFVTSISANYLYIKNNVIGEVNVLNDYNKWEHRLLMENPDYDDMKILVDISEKRLYLLDGNKLIKSYIIASGRLKTPSPIGSWRIVNKAKWGGAFGTRWMGLNVPWGRFGIHGTDTPSSIGYDASAGCIRMRNQDVEDLYRHVKVGTPVAIVNGALGPFGYGLKPIQPGDFGADVMEVQRRLQVLGYYELEQLNGRYGKYMEMVLYRFQEDNGIPQNPIISHETFNALKIVMME